MQHFGWLPPEHVLEAAERAAHEVVPAPPTGFPELRQAISARIEREQGLSLDPEREIIVTYAAMVHTSLEAAERLEREDGISVEVLDLRTLLPLDEEAIVSSVKKTNRALIVHEDTQTAGFGAEIAAVVAKEAFWWLDAPVERLCVEDVPMPYHPVLLDAVLPSVEVIAERLGALLKV